MMHIQSLEDTVVALSDNEDNTIEYKKAKRIASNIKRKKKLERTRMLIIAILVNLAMIY